MSLIEKCDNKFDCPDKSDEKNCNLIFNFFHPKINKTINPLFFCDYIQNYGEGEDEKNCGRKIFFLNFFQIFICKILDFKKL